MIIETIDWIIIAIYFIVALAIGIWASKKAGNDTTSFFLAGRNMPWWLLGVSMVATTFSTDTPNLITDLVRQNGVSGNWSWWAFLLTGMLTVFIYSKLWHRSGVTTDIEFYELRYGGKPAALLRGFRALYLGLIFNVLVMGAVSLAAIKFGEIVLGMPGWVTLTIAGVVTLIYSLMGGLKAVIITDFIQFILAMVGSLWATVYILNIPEVGGISGLLKNENVVSKISLFPDMSNPDIWIPLFLVPLAVQWWATYYPGSEPGGGGFIAQRMFSAKDEKNALFATLLFNIAHYALRPWPWILIALSSLIIFPELKDIQNTFPNLPNDKLGHDVAYPAMLTLLPPGLLGLVCASLIAAYMSTMSTLLNLGSSYMVNDFYVRFLNKNANDKKKLFIGRLFIIFFLIVGGGFGLILSSATEAFNIMLMMGAGTGLIYLLRWFWWRINAYSEIVAMISSVVIASFFNFTNLGLADWQKIVFGAISTTIVWITSTYLTPPEDDNVLLKFVKKINPGGPGWRRFSANKVESWSLPIGILQTFLGSTMIYCFLLGTGNFIYGNLLIALIMFSIALIFFTFLLKTLFYDSNLK